ncbi:YlbD family protein [Aquibacillus kalidii]|uniref:YlbD family protein n=1 Tax=Aquibacillus kalidii TaxID=2762597 RepID=UPI0016476476|nr:YlbD family protein [Aquibacillus kalidii]
MSKKEEEELSPSIKEFKQFVKQHPGLIKNVRRGKGDWQSYFEKYVLLGEDDPSWEKYKSADFEDNDLNAKTKEKSSTKNKKSKDKQEFMNQFMKYIENVDFNKVEGHINQINGALSNIQTLVGQFKDVKNKTTNNSNSGRPPFMNND